MRRNEPNGKTRSDGRGGRKGRKCGGEYTWSGRLLSVCRTRLPIFSGLLSWCWSAGACGGLVLGTGSLEDAQHAEITLVAGVLVELIPRVAQRDHRGPRLGPGGGIIDRDFVLKAVGASAGEALNDVQLIARVHEGSGLVVGGIDDQRIALPMTARVTEPGPDRGRKMRTPVEWNDARVVNRLHQDGHGVA